MHVLVTGAGGLIGRATVKEMRAGGWRVTGVARRACAEADVMADLRRPIKGWPRPDAVVHLAGGYAGAGARELAESDLAIARNLIEWGRREGIQRWVFASAAEVYGRIEGVGDETAATRPAIPFGHVKLEVEGMMTAMAAKIPGCRLAILRIGEVYGAESRLLNELTARLGSGFCPWAGSGRVALSFVDVEDVAQALRLAAERAPEGASIYNVGDDEPATWREFVDQIAKKMGTRGATPLPASLAYGYMAGHRLACAIRGREPVLTVPVLRLVMTAKVLRNDKIKRELGLRIRYPGFLPGLEAILDGVSNLNQDGRAQGSAPGAPA
jgi:nucleoside-diphosphate-sugar epimerase